MDRAYKGDDKHALSEDLDVEVDTAYETASAQ